MFVVADALLDRFSMDWLRDWLALLSEAGLLAAGCSDRFLDSDRRVDE